MISVQLIHNPKSLFHNDLFLIIPSMSVRIKADSYYLVTDHTILPDEGSYTKVLLVLKSMLTRWQLLIEGLAQGEEVFLPFDLADQCVGGLYTRLHGDNIGVQYVITNQYHGYHFIASKLRKVTLAQSRDPFFWGDETIMPRVQFIEEVEKAKNSVDLSHKLS